MGCDIHAVVEYNNYGSHWSAFGEIGIPRDYDLFSVIAFGDGGCADKLPYPPRGLPSDVSLMTHSLVFMDAQEYKQLMKGHGIEVEIDIESMEEWERTEYLATGAVVGPDWHTASWLDFSELEEALKQGGIRAGKQSPEVKALICAMKVLAEAYGPEKVRLVFWFDG
jgi:hypothetical protein